MKHVLSAFLMLLMVFILVSCSNTKDDQLLKNIEVFSDIDQQSSKATIFVTNKGSRSFKGNVSIYFKNSAGKKVEHKRDIIVVGYLPAGSTTYAKYPVSETQDLKIEYCFKCVEFGEETPNSSVFNKQASQNLTIDIQESFPADWNQYVDKIEVFNSMQENFSVVTANTTDPKTADSIGSFIFTNYKDSYRLERVLLISRSGETLFERAI